MLIGGTARARPTWRSPSPPPSSARASGPFLQPRRSGQPARAGESRRPERTHRRALLRHDLDRHRRTRLSAVQPDRRPAALPPDQQALREHLGRHHHQSRLRRVAAGLRRRQDDHGHARPAHPPLRHRRDRQRELALQKQSLIGPRLGCARRLRAALRQGLRATPPGDCKRRRQGANIGSERGDGSVWNLTNMQPSRELKSIQYFFLNMILNEQPVHPTATAYAPGSSIRGNAALHANSRVILKLDFVSFLIRLNYQIGCVTLNDISLPGHSTISNSLLIYCSGAKADTCLVAYRSARQPLRSYPI